MDIFATFATDEKLEVEGKWVPLSKDAKALVARSGNDKFNKTLRARLKESQVDLSGADEANNELIDAAIVETMAETILLGWSGFTAGKDKTPVTYSREQALTYLKVKDFRKKIEAISGNFETFRAQEEVAQGNA